MLNDVAKLLGSLVDTAWRSNVDTWGSRVLLARQYAEGEHRAKMTPAMREMLRVSGTVTDQFNDNYCEMVVDSMADRLTVTAIEGDTEAATEWASTVLQDNRFDGLQMDAHTATIRDGDTFVMVSYDSERGRVLLTHEPAYDGTAGVIPVYDRMARELVAAVKVWIEGDDKRINLYYPDRVEKYLFKGAAALTSGTLTKLDEAEWVDATGRALGVPLFHLRNKPQTRRSTGLSEISNVIPLQDALNRTLVSMVLTAELTAFQVRVARGFDPPTNLSPGMWVVIGQDGLANDQIADASVMEQGQIVPFIAQADWLINQIGTISRTPLPSLMGGDGESGEALKEREKGLLSKVTKFTVKNGNVWEDVMAYAARLQNTFGTTLAPASLRWFCRWQSAELRNQSEVVKNAVLVADRVSEREFLRMIAPVFNWDAAKIEAILLERAEDTSRNVGAAGAFLPQFNLTQAEVAPPAAQQTIAA